MDCDFYVPDPENAPDRKVCRRERCGRVVVDPAAVGSLLATCRVDGPPTSKPRTITPEQLRRSPTFESGLECVHRGELLGSVSNGLCCGGSYLVRTAVCREFSVCSEEPVANGKAQLVDGVRPTSCVDCAKRLPPKSLTAVAETPGRP